MSKEVHFGSEAMSKMIIGLDKIANAVGLTLGPKGKNVFIDDAMTPKITNDGATIASNITFEDKLENAGAYVIKNTSGQTNDDAGDGTTTTAVLTQSVIHECLKRPENAVEIENSIKEAGIKILKILAKKSQPITKDDVEKVALLSVEQGNKQLAKIISQIINKLGEKAVINVEDSKTFATEYEIVDGYEAPVGFMSPHFINDTKASRAVFTDVPVLVSFKKISNLGDIGPIFELFKTKGIRSCVIVCEDIDDSILGILVQNKLMGTFSSLVIRANGPLLEDIEGVVGATAISEGKGISFQNFTLDHLGNAKKIVCTGNKTLFLGDGIGAKMQADNLEAQAENEPNMYTARILKQRVAKLRGGIAVLKIGAPTDFERDYLRLKAEDAVKAVQCALAEGVVEGGGMALYRIAEELKPKTIGEQILKKVLTSPLRKIVENAGKDYAEIIKNMPEGMGYDAKNDTYVNLIEAGIIDPSKVERCALENAISSASKFITTEACIVDAKETK